MALLLSLYSVNSYELLSQGKKSLVFVNKLKDFIKVGNITDFKKLLSIMSKTAFEKADKKIQLTKIYQGVKVKQMELFEANL